MRDDSYVPATAPSAVILDKLIELETALEIEPDPSERRVIEAAASEVRHALYRAQFVRRSEEGAIYFAAEYDHTYEPPPGYRGPDE